MKRDWDFTITEIAVTMGIVATLVGLLVPALVSTRELVQKGRESQAKASPDASWFLRTQKHDGHWWVIYEGGDSHPFVHHPDCPCMRKAEKE